MVGDGGAWAWREGRAGRAGGASRGVGPQAHVCRRPGPIVYSSFLILFIICVLKQQQQGADEAKAELQQVVQYLRNPAEFTRLGGRLPKGILLKVRFYFILFLLLMVFLKLFFLAFL